jgi:hypothetical protein
MRRKTLMLLFSALIAVSAEAVKQEGLVTPEDERAIALAIEDEIYDRNLQGYYADVGGGLGQYKSRVQFYIEPYIHQGVATLIYKFMPYGEVYRVFWIRDDGLARLDGNPDIGFPPTQRNFLTLYGDDDSLCRRKHEWLKFYFAIEIQPTNERIAEAVARQKKRTGRSVREEKAQESRRKQPSSE